MALADSGRLDRNELPASDALSPKSDGSIAPSSTGDTLVDCYAEGGELVDASLTGDQLDARLRRLSASVNWNGQADRAAIVRLYFQFVVSGSCDTIPLLLDPEAAIGNPNVKLFQHTRFLPAPTPLKRDVSTDMQHTRDEGVLKEAKLDLNLPSSTIHPTTSPPNFRPLPTYPASSRPSNTVNTMENHHQTPTVDLESEEATLAVALGAGSKASACDSPPRLQDSFVEVVDSQPGWYGCEAPLNDSSRLNKVMDAKSQTSGPPSTPSDALSAFSSLPCGAIDENGNDMMNSSVFSAFRDALNTPLGASERGAREASEESKVTMRPLYPKAVNNVGGPATPKHAASQGNRPIEKLQRRESTASDTPTRIPAPVWKEIMTSHAQHPTQSPTHSSTNPDTKASRNKVHFFTTQATKSPRPHSSTTSSPSNFSKRYQDMPFFSKTLGHTTPLKTLRKVSSHQELSPLTHRSSNPTLVGNRKRSRSVGGVEDPFIGTETTGAPTTSRSSHGDTTTDQTSQGSSVISCPQKGRGAKSTSQTVVSSPIVGSSKDQSEPSHGEEKLVSLSRDDKGRLCIFRDGGFEPGHYQLDIELVKELSVMNRNNIQTLHLPDLEPKFLGDNSFHDGKMLLHVHGPWSHDNLRIFSHDFIEHNMLNPTFMIGTFKLDSMPTLHVQRKGRVRVYDNPIMRLSTEVAISLLSSKEARINYKIQIACEEQGSEIFAEKVVFELTLSNVPVKGKAYVLEPGTSQLQLELLSTSEDYSTSSHQAFITIFRDAKDLGSMLCLRFSTFLPLSQQADIMVPAIRFTRGVVEAETVSVIEPPCFWIAEPTSSAGTITWRMTRLLETKQKGLCFTRRKVPISSTRGSTPVDRVRLRELRWPEFPPMGRMERVSIVMAHGLQYKVFLIGETVRCEFEVKVQRLSRPEVATIFSKGWELLNAFLDGEQVMATPPRSLPRDPSESSTGLATIDVVIRHIATACQKKQDRWHFRKENRTPSQSHIKMAFALSEEALGHLFPHELGFGLLPMPKLLNAWIVNASVESGLDNGMHFRDQKSDSVMLMPVAASVVYRRYVTTNTDHVEAPLSPWTPFSLQTLDPAHEICIQCFNPISEVGESFMGSRKRITGVSVPSDPPSPIFLPTLRPVSELSTQSSACSSLPGDDYSNRASTATTTAPARLPATAAKRSHPSAALRQRAKKIPALDAKTNGATPASHEGPSKAVKATSDERRPLKGDQSTTENQRPTRSASPHAESRSTSQQTSWANIIWPRGIAVVLLASLLFLFVETSVVLPELHPIRRSLRSMFSPPAHFLNSSDERHTGSLITYNPPSSPTPAASTADSTREATPGLDVDAASPAPSATSLFAPGGTTKRPAVPPEESVAPLLRRYDQGEDDEELQRDIQTLYRTASVEVRAADGVTEEGETYGRVSGEEEQGGQAAGMSLLDRFDRALGWRPLPEV